MKKRNLLFLLPVAGMILTGCGKDDGGNEPTAPNPYGTEESPITVETAYDLASAIENNGSETTYVSETEKFFVGGLVTSVKTESDNQGYTIQLKDSFDSAKFIEAYKVSKIEADINAPEVGDKLTVVGFLANYNNYKMEIISKGEDVAKFYLPENVTNAITYSGDEHGRIVSATSGQELPASELNNQPVKFKVEFDQGYGAKKVLANDEILYPNDSGIYEFKPVCPTAISLVSRDLSVPEKVYDLNGYNLKLKSSYSDAEEPVDVYGVRFQWNQLLYKSGETKKIIQGNQRTGSTQSEIYNIDAFAYTIEKVEIKYNAATQLNNKVAVQFTDYIDASGAWDNVEQFDAVHAQQGQSDTITVTPTRDAVYMKVGKLSGAGYGGAVYIDSITVYLTDTPLNAVQSIAITTNPKTEYYVGDYVDTTGMVVKATRTTGEPVEVTNYTVSPAAGVPLALTDDKIVVSYKGKTAEVAITVIEDTRPVTSMSIAGELTKTAYAVGEPFSTDGLKVMVERDGANAPMELSDAFYDLKITPEKAIAESDSISATVSVELKGGFTFAGTMPTKEVTLSATIQKGTQWTPFTVEEGYDYCAALADGGYSDKKVAVEGIITSTISKSSKNTDVKFDMTVNDKTIVVYYAGIFQDYTSDKMDVGGKVVVYGYMQNYVAKNGNHTYEFTTANDEKPVILDYSLAVTSVSFDVETATIIASKSTTLQLNATVAPAKATNKAVTYSVESGENVVSVNQNGLVTAIANSGTAVVKVTTEDGSFTDTVTITVVEDLTLSSVEIKGELETTDYYVGDEISTAGLSVLAHYSEGSQYDETLAATAYTLTVTTGDTSTAGESVSITITAAVTGTTITTTKDFSIVVKALPTYTDSTVNTNTATFADGAFTWSLANGKVIVSQLKGSSSTNVNSSYKDPIRMYKGHILEIKGIDGYKIAKIEIVIDTTYIGADITANTEVSNNDVTDNTKKVTKSLTTTSGGTHTFTTVDRSGESAVYIQNTNANASKQLRFKSFKVYYVAA